MISGSTSYFDDYNEGEEINHLDGQTIEEAEHQLATRFIKIMLEFILINMSKKMVDLEGELSMGVI